MKVTAIGQSASLRVPAESPFSMSLRVLFMLVFDVGAAWFAQNAVARGFIQLAVIVGLIAVMFNLIFLISRAYPFRWMAFGLAFLTLFTIYPIFFTIYVAFTNYGDGHLLTKEQALPIIQKATYLPETGKSYNWTAYKSGAGQYALWLVNANGESFLARPGEEIKPARPGDHWAWVISAYSDHGPRTTR
jgi:hypothetical protein